MLETRRLLEAAAALSTSLVMHGVPHAFFGSVMVAMLAEQTLCDEIYCIVQGGLNRTHPFGLVRDALARNQNFTLTHSPWSDRLHVVYHTSIPKIEIEILPAGETGPRQLDHTNVTLLQNLPFLSISEVVRAKLNFWSIRRLERDAQEICFLMSRYWDSVDINRIPEHEMTVFVDQIPRAAKPWKAIKQKYGL